MYIDDVRITNTWPAASKWYEGRVDGNSHSVSVEPRTRYHWRIDTVVDGNTYKGSWWTFSTGRSNPGVLLHYSFTGTQGNGLPDYPTAIPDNTGDFEFYKYVDPCGSGSVKYGTSNPVYDADGTSAAFDPCAGLYRLDPCAAEPEKPDLLRLDGYQYTIEMWIRPEALVEEKEDQYLIGKSGANTWSIYINDPGECGGCDNELRWVRNGGQIDVEIEDWLDWANPEWLHVAVVFDQSQSDDDRAKMFFYGQQVGDSDGASLNAADNNSPVAVGFRVPADGNVTNGTEYFQGLIDEVRILDVALHPAKFLLVPGEEWASYPRPEDRAIDIDPNDANVVLSWAPGSKAATHRVYLSTDFYDVNTGSINAYLGEFEVNEVNNLNLEFGQVYYWRVDEVNGTTWPGVMWRFTTKFLIGDENRILWYRFNEDGGRTATDASGYSKHGTIELDDGVYFPHWEPASGRFGGCLGFDGDTSIDVPSEVLANVDAPISDEITISVWLYGVQQSGDNLVLQAGDDGNYLEVLVPDDDGYVYWQAGNDSNDATRWEVPTDGWWDNWHHLAFVKDESADKMYIYFDGDLAWSKPGGTISSLSGVVGEDFTIGEYFDYEGKMDDFRIYNYAKPESEIEELYRGGDLASAWGPSPYDGRIDTPRDANLAWNAGDYADSHDVYFGTDYAAVRDANTAVTMRVFRGNTTDEFNDIEILDLDTYYYWRIDEVNDPNKWKGNVWKFKVADHIILDDFEIYQDDSHLQSTWSDMATQPIGRTTGARLYLGKYSSSVKYLPHGGDQIMRFGFCNCICMISDVRYSETWLRMTPDKKDWTQEDVKALTLFFYGLPTNEVYEQDQMYVGIEDTGGKYAEIRYGDYERTGEEDINDLNEPEWHKWFIGLPDFNDPCYAAVPNDVDLTDVNRLYIGFGNRRTQLCGGNGEVRFDDIRLSRSICRPEFVKPVADFTGPRGVPDCVVDLADIGYVADEWLKSDANFADIMEEPCDANIVGHWKLDQDPCDSSSYNHYGYIDGTAYSWVTGHDGEVSNPALEFTGGGTRVLVDDSNDLKPEYAVTASAWVYYTESQSSSRVVVKGADNAETYELELDGLNNFVFLVRDVNGDKFDVGEDESFVWRNEWIHIAGTFDGDANTVKSYVNGQLKGSRADANFVKLGKTLSQDTAGLAIGNRSDDTNRQFTGAVDEVRI
ncbi:MAG: LamG domain-containing protein, partial [Planctomycetota bacterium]